jgi:hypothetical protein
LSDEEEAGNAGEQPARNNLTDWNGQGEFLPTNFGKIIPRNYVSENPSATQ